MNDASPRRIAIIGSGVSGLTAAYVASASARVTLFEADDRLGGHADTHVVDEDGHELAIDTGFIVHNRRTYPTLLRLFEDLEVPTQESDMSMSVRSDAAGLEWAGALGLKGVLPTWRHAVRPSYLRMLVEIPRFHRRARALLDERGAGDEQTLESFLDTGGFSPFFRRHFMAPLVAAVWSCDPAIALDYPARYLFRFLAHHGMLQVFGSPRWRTVTGGSRTYVERVERVLHERGADVRTGTKVTSVAETPEGVEVTDGNGVLHSFDAVVLATHPGQSLAMLAAPTAVQSELLGAMPYSANLAQLHTDTSVLPRNRRAWASWNQLERPDTGVVTVTYDLTRLMSLPGDRRYLVTLGAPDLVDQSTVLATMDYEHPIYTPASVAAQQRHLELESPRLAFAGAWQGWGFHEDGARSGAAAAERLGFAWPQNPVVEVRAERASRRPASKRPAEPRVYRTAIQHTRRTPVKKRFTHTSHFWVVDVDALPDHGRLAFLKGSFESRDHFGSPAPSIRDNVEAYLLAEGIDLDGGQILMATTPRAFGHCFNPISVFWCTHRDGSRAATVVEVHNTYGDRHTYLVQPDDSGRASVPKAMYVSPFHGVDGRYDLIVPTPDHRLFVSVRLTTDAGEVFDASMRGESVAVSPLRAAPAGLLGALLIRAHGIALWLRRVPVRPRPTHRQKSVQ